MRGGLFEALTDLCRPGTPVRRTVLTVPHVPDDRFDDRVDVAKLAWVATGKGVHHARPR